MCNAHSISTLLNMKHKFTFIQILLMNTAVSIQAVVSFSLNVLHMVKFWKIEVFFLFFKLLFYGFILILFYQLFVIECIYSCMYLFLFVFCCLHVLLMLIFCVQWLMRCCVVDLAFCLCKIELILWQLRLSVKSWWHQ